MQEAQGTTSVVFKKWSTCEQSRASALMALVENPGGAKLAARAWCIAPGPTTFLIAVAGMRFVAVGEDIACGTAP